MGLAPRIEGQGGLLKQRRRHQSAGDGQIQLIKIRFPGNLEGFLHPDPAQHAPLHRGGGQLFHIVHTPEQDSLPGGQIHQLQRLPPGTPQMLHLQPPDRPAQLGIGAVRVRTADLPHHQQIGFWVFHQVINKPQRRRRGFFGAFAALDDPIPQGTIPKRPVSASDDFRQRDLHGVRHAFFR